MKLGTLNTWYVNKLFPYPSEHILINFEAIRNT